MLRALLLAALLLPTASAWGLTAHPPEAAAAGVPYLLEVCVDAPSPAELRVGTAPYAPTTPGCHDVRSPPGNLTLRLRPPGGAAKATLPLTVPVVDAPLANVAVNSTISLLDAQGHVLLRTPGPWLPLLPGAARWRDADGDHPLPPPDKLTLVEVRGPPFQGVLLRNDGAGAARLAGRFVGRAPLPEATLAPGESAFVGAQPTPDARFVAWSGWPRAGPWTLRAADRVEARVENVTRALGIARVPPEPHLVEGAMRLYATPDAGEAPLLDVIDAAQREILVEGYTMTSADVAAAFARALARGVAVRVLLEGGPVGGRPPEEEPLVAALVARGAWVAFLGSEGAFPARFATLHAKAIVADRERVLVSTDNFHEGSYPAQPGAGTTRGFGVVIENASLAQAMGATMDADMAPWPDVHEARLDALPPPAPLAPRAGEPGPSASWRGAWNVTIADSPFDGEEALLRMIANATRRVDAALLFADARFGTDTDPFVEALVAAAQRGAQVRLLLDARTDEGRNAALMNALNARAARQELRLEVREADVDRTLHAKMVVADDAFYVGSMNWGNASARRNREVGLVVESAEGAAWLEAQYEKDWRGPAPEAREAPGLSLPASLAALALGARRTRASRRARGRSTRP